MSQSTRSLEQDAVSSHHVGQTTKRSVNARALDMMAFAGAIGTAVLTTVLEQVILHEEQHLPTAKHTYEERTRFRKFMYYVF